MLVKSQKLISLFVIIANVFSLQAFDKSTIDIPGQVIERHHYCEIDSTQTASLRYAQDVVDVTKWLLISADIQTAGINIERAPWRSDIPNNVYCTLNMNTSDLSLSNDSIDRIRIADHQNEIYTIRNIEDLSERAIAGIPAIAVCNVVKKLVRDSYSSIASESNIGISRTKLNSVLINGKKFCGIMCDIREISENSFLASIGIGVKVNMTSDELKKITPKDIVTSLSEELQVDSKIDNEKMLNDILQEIVILKKEYINNEGAFLSKLETYLI